MELVREVEVEKAKPSTRSQVFAVRVTEAAVIAIVAASLSVWGTTKVLAVQLENMQESMRKVEHRVDKIYNDFYAPRLGAAAVRQVAVSAADMQAPPIEERPAP